MNYVSEVKKCRVVLDNKVVLSAYIKRVYKNTCAHCLLPTIKRPVYSVRVKDEYLAIHLSKPKNPDCLRRWLQGNPFHFVQRKF